MNCFQESRLYVKANGEVPCFCDVGEDKILHNVDAKTDFVNEILLGKKYRHIKESLKAGKYPWPDICRSCVFMDESVSYSELPSDERKIGWLQVEPSYLCNLSCITCIEPEKRMDKKSPPYNIPFSVLKKLVDDLIGAGYEVEHFNFQGRGEPLMNKDIWKMVSYTRERFPDSEISLNTNGNFKYTDDFVNSGLSRLVVAVDGCYQESYKVHRKGGKIDKAFRLMEKFSEAREKSENDVELVWQYVLFEHNDSNNELVDAQKKAMELGVDLLEFDITFWVYSGVRHSRFFDLRELAKFPLSEPVNYNIRSSFPHLFSRSNLDTVMDNIQVDDIKGEGIKNIVVFGSSPLKIIDSCLKSISKSMPGASVDLLSGHKPDPAGYGMNLNVIPFKSGTHMCESTIDKSLFRPSYDMGIICSYEGDCFPGKMNVIRLASKVNCARTAFFTDRNSLYLMKNGA